MACKNPNYVQLKSLTTQIRNFFRSFIFRLDNAELYIWNDKLKWNTIFKILTFSFLLHPIQLLKNDSFLLLMQESEVSNASSTKATF